MIFYRMKAKHAQEVTDRKCHTHQQEVNKLKEVIFTRLRALHSALRTVCSPYIQYLVCMHYYATTVKPFRNSCTLIKRTNIHVIVPNGLMYTIVMYIGRLKSGHLTNPDTLLSQGCLD